VSTRVCAEAGVVQRNAPPLLWYEKRHSFALLIGPARVLVAVPRKIMRERAQQAAGFVQVLL
jgi:hypothetical protein